MNAPLPWILFVAALWLLSAAAAYLLMRWSVRSDRMDVWTCGDRLFLLILCGLFGPGVLLLFAVALALGWLFRRALDDDTPADW